MDPGKSREQQRLVLGSTYDPPGTRYDRDYKRIIYRVYPPGVRPDAEPANPFGLGDSKAEVPE